MAKEVPIPLSPAQRSKVRRLSAAKDPEPGEEAGELNIIPYLDIITNLLVFILASISVTFISQLETTPPSIGGGKVKQQVDSKALNLAVLITRDGIGFKTSGGNIATGCNDVGAGVTIPKSGEAYDLKALTACARKLKSARPEFEDETQVTITANRDVEYRHIIDVLDSIRRDERGELFPEFHLGVAR